MSELKRTLRARKLRNNQTNVEAIIWNKLRNRQLNGVKFRRQQPLGKYIVDFVSLERKLVVELDGGQHNQNAHDQERTLWLNKEGYKVVRFWNNEITENLQGALETIEKAIFNPHPHLLP